MEKTITVKLINELKEVERLVDIIYDWSNELSIDATSMYEISIVFDEIIANIIKHGYEDKTEHYIDVTLNLKEDTLTTVIEDDGIEFNPLDFSKDDSTLQLQDREIGGRGIQIIKWYIDAVDYRRRDNKNILTINRKIKFKE